MATRLTWLVILSVCCLLIPAAATTGDDLYPKSETIKVQQGNVRGKPLKKAPVIGSVKQGDRVTLLEQEGKWFYGILPGGSAGWLHRILLVDRNKTMRLGTPAGNVRKRPTMSSRIIYVLKRGDTVAVIGSSKNWYRIRLSHKKTGWAHKALFTNVLKGKSKPQPALHRLLEIKTAAISQDEERVLFILSSFIPPSVFTIEGRRPMVICDFHGVDMDAQAVKPAGVDARLIRSVKVLAHSVSESITRAIIELAPDNDYDIQQVFYKEDRIYALSFRRL